MPLDRNALVAAYDFIIVGAGTAGWTVAARLTEDPAVRVLLIEAGGPDRGPIIAMPAALPFAYQSKKLGWGYQSGPEPFLDGRTIDEKRGRVIGGSSSINAMIFNRGNPMDFERWAEMGLPDWSYAHCLPYFRRMETFAGGKDQWRGGSGPKRGSPSRAGAPVHRAFPRGGGAGGLSVTPDQHGARPRGGPRAAW